MVKKVLKVIEAMEKEIDVENPIKIKTLQQIRKDGFPELKWRINKLVPHRGITIFGGPSGSYKTWVAMAMALSCATGEEFLFNFYAEPCNVLYIDEENGEITLPNRFELLIKGHCIEHPLDNLNVSMFNNLKLDSPKVEGYLKEIIKKRSIKLVIIDSMVRCMIGQEDKANDVRQVFDTLKRLFKDYEELAFVILHHTSKTGKGLNSLRGSGDFGAFADVVLMFNSNYRRVVNVDVVKNRHIDLSEFSKFSIEITKTDTDGLSFSYRKFEDANCNVIDDCKADMLDYFEDNNIDIFQTGELMKAMKKEHGYKKNTFHSARRELLDENKIKKIGHGRYRVLKDLFKEEVVK